MDENWTRKICFVYTLHIVCYVFKQNLTENILILIKRKVFWGN